MEFKKNTEKKLFYESFAKDFDEKMNKYDLSRRLKIIFEEFITEDITGKKLLDAGCGTGHFSKMACDRGAIVTSLDVGESLLLEVSRK